MHGHASTTVGDIFSSAGPLARALPGFEPRDGQRQMAEAVAAVVDTGGVLLAEAGTGTGKTLAYLIPAILSGQRVIVSTGTKNLQEQIFFKDLPALREALGVPFTATLMKGRSNYLCLHRFETLDSGSQAGNPRLFESPDHQVFLPIIRRWAGTTTTGDRAELRDLPEDLPMWGEVAATADTCLGTDCPRYGDCFVTLMRQRAAESDVVIVNHHLLCADASVRQGAFGEVVPGAPTLVVDEAHQLEDVATQYFGFTFSNHGVDDLVRDAQRLAWSAGRGHGSTQREEVSRAIQRVADRSRAFFAVVSSARAWNTGAAEVRQVFPLAKGFVAGCLVTEGKINRNASARLRRGREIIYEGKVGTLKRFKDDANEVRAGLECGIKLDDFNGYQPGDVIECYEVQKVRAAL